MRSENERLKTIQGIHWSFALLGESGKTSGVLIGLSSNVFKCSSDKILPIAERIDLGTSCS